MIINENISCPFCGHHCNEEWLEIEGDANDFVASCGNCGSRSSWARSIEEAINNWNTRETKQTDEFLRGYLQAKRDFILFLKRMNNDNQ